MNMKEDDIDSPEWPSGKIVKKANDAQREAWRRAHEESMRNDREMRKRDFSGGGCFIATVAFDDNPSCEELIILRKFRDEQLVHSNYGRLFIKIYYKLGPYAASWIRQKPKIKQLVRRCLLKVVNKLKGD